RLARGERPDQVLDLFGGPVREDRRGGEARCQVTGRRSEHAVASERLGDGTSVAVRATGTSSTIRPRGIGVAGLGEAQPPVPDAEVLTPGLLDPSIDLGCQSLALAHLFPP